MRRIGIATALIIASFVAIRAVPAGLFGDSPAVSRTKKAVTDIVSLPDGAVLVRNEHAGLFESLDWGRTWRKTSGQVRTLAVSNGDKLWAFYGWPGIHESPSAAIAYSADRGRTWQEKKFHVPDSRSEAMYSHLPATFLNAPTEEPLVLMFNLQILRPVPGKEPESWTKIGVPIPATSRPFGQWDGGAAAHQGTYYVAYESQIFMSTDGAMTWSAKTMHRFFDGRIQCRFKTCFALLNGLGSEWSGLFTVTAGRNDWAEIGSLSIDAIRAALKPISKNRSPIERFGACDLLVTDEGVFVAGIVNAGSKSWGAVLLAKSGMSLKPVGNAVDEGLWRLHRDGRGVTWAGGQGAFQLRAGEWQLVWPGE